MILSKEKRWFCIKGSRIKYNCEVCGKVCEQKTNVYQKSRHHYCSTACKAIGQSRKVECTCEVCGKTVLQKQTDYDRHKHHYCSQTCSAIGTHQLNSEERVCEICGAKFTVRKSVKQRFCGTKCQSEWQRTQTGELSTHFHQEEVECEWCHKRFSVRQSKANDGRHHFCSTECRQKWYATIWSQADEWKEASRKRAAQMISDNLIFSVHSAPQIIVNHLLDSIGVQYENEHLLGGYSIDNYLTDYGLSIEVMGDFWHCSVMKFDNISQPIQIKNVNRDRRKRRYIYQQTGSYALYLWESDVIDHQDLCVKLIQLYLTNGGRLDNYNSFNYHVSGDVAILNDTIIKPYQEMSRGTLNKFIKA